MMGAGLSHLSPFLRGEVKKEIYNTMFIGSG
jgi:hypothetical protein